MNETVLTRASLMWELGGPATCFPAHVTDNAQKLH